MNLKIKDIFPKILKYFIFFILEVLLIYIIFFQFNYLWIDITWHIASAKILWTSWFHNFYEGWYLWYIQNLYYPPLEDFLIWVFAWFGNLDFVMWYKIYLLVLLNVFIFWIYRLDKFFVSNISKIVFYIFMLVFLCLEKDWLTTFQGLWLFDAFITWLSSEILWWVFFVFMLYEFFDNKDKKYLWLLLFFAMISHLVMWPLVFGLMIFFIIFNKRFYLIKHVILWFWLASFFVFPFLLNKTWVVMASVLYTWTTWALIWLYVFLVLWLILFILLNKYNISVLLFSWIFFLLPAFIFIVFWKNIFPNFHYYRLIIVSLFFYLLSIVFLLDYIIQSKSKNKEIFLAILVLFVWFSFYALNFKIHYFSFYQTKPYHKYLNVNLNENQMKEFANKITDKQKRVLFIPDQRQHDNYVSSLFISKWYDINWVNWLYWESSMNNYYMSNYLSNIFTYIWVVLEADYIWWLSCNKTFWLFEDWLADNNVWYFIIKNSDKSLNNDFVRWEKIDCLTTKAEMWSQNFKYYNLWEYNFDDKLNQNYNLIKVENVMNLMYNNDIVEFFPNYQAYKTDTRKKLFFWQYVRDKLENIYSQLDKEKIYLYNDEYEKFLKNNPKIFKSTQIKPNNYTFKKLSTNKFEINIENKEDILFKIKYSYYNWFKLFSQDWKEIPIYNWVMWMYAKWHWKMILEFQKPLSYIIPYVISFMFLIAYLIYIFDFLKYINIKKIVW